MADDILPKMMILILNYYFLESYFVFQIVKELQNFYNDILQIRTAKLNHSE